MPEFSSRSNLALTYLNTRKTLEAESSGATDIIATDGSLYNGTLAVYTYENI